jgi:hypothetical protein
MPFMSADGAEFHYREARHRALLAQSQATNAAINRFRLET